MHGLGAMIHPTSFLGPTGSVTAAWANGELIASERTLGVSSPAMVSTDDAMSECWRAGLCTYFATGDVPLTQCVYACDTCMRQVCEARKGVECEDDCSAGCEVAVLVCLLCACLGSCHRGHVLIPLGRCNLVLCDCGRGQVSLLQPHQRRMIKRALHGLPRSSSAPFVTASSSRLLSTPIPPLPLRLNGSECIPEYAVQKRRVKKKDQNLIKWLGWAHSSDTWSAPPLMHTTPAAALIPPLLTPACCTRSAVTGVAK